MARTRRGTILFGFRLGRLQANRQIYLRRSGDERHTPHQVLDSNTKESNLVVSRGRIRGASKTASETIGITQMAEGLGRKVTGEVYVDSSAALAVVNRKGCGKLRHVRVGQLWVQQLAEEEEMSFKKVWGEDNPADLCTKHLTRIRIDKLIAMISLHHREGKANEGLNV